MTGAPSPNTAIQGLGTPRDATHAETKEAMQTNPDQPGWSTLIAAGLPSLFFFGISAFISHTGIELQNFTWHEWWTLSAETREWSLVYFFSSFYVNYIQALQTIPKAVKWLKDNFRENFGRNIAIFILAICAAVVGGAVAFPSALALGTAVTTALAFSAGWVAALSTIWAIVAAIGTGLILFATRVYGLINGIERFQRWWNQENARYYLSRLDSNYNARLEQALTSGGHKLDNLDSAAMDCLLKELHHIWENDGDQALTPTGWSDYINKAVFGASILIAIVGAIAIIPAFAQKFFNGLTLIFGSLPLLAANPNLTMLLCVGLSIANPILYLGSLIALLDLGISAVKNIYNNHTNWKDTSFEIFKLLVLAAICYFSGASLFALTLSTFNDHHFIFKSLVGDAPASSTVGQYFIHAAEWAAALVNLKFCFSNSFPAPAPKEQNIAEKAAGWLATKNLNPEHRDQAGKFSSRLFKPAPKTPTAAPDPGAYCRQSLAPA